MPYQLKSEADVEPLVLGSVQQIRDAEKMLYDMLGYRGSFSTTASVDSQGVVHESARLDLVVGGGVPVNAGLGEVIVYRTDPPEVVGCMTQEQFNAGYQEK